MFPLSPAMPAPKSISLAARFRRVKLFLTGVNTALIAAKGETGRLVQTQREGAEDFACGTPQITSLLRLAQLSPPPPA
jgi:hypothetical protein